MKVVDIGAGELDGAEIETDAISPSFESNVKLALWISFTVNVPVPGVAGARTRASSKVPRVPAERTIGPDNVPVTGPPTAEADPIVPGAAVNVVPLFGPAESGGRATDVPGATVPPPAAAPPGGGELLLGEPEDGGATTDCVWLYELFAGFGSLTPCGVVAVPMTLTVLPTAPVTLEEKRICTAPPGGRTGIATPLSS